jgi:hypothetical protein
MPDLSINAKTGELVLGAHKFAPALGEPDFLKSGIDPKPERIARPSSSNFYELIVPIGVERNGDVMSSAFRREVVATLEFAAGGPLQGIRLKFLQPEMKSSAWSKQVEDEIKRSHDQWLKEQLGRPSYLHQSDPSYQFRWGRVASIVQQPHLYSANIIVDYTRGGARRMRLTRFARMAKAMGLSGLSNHFFRATLK